MRRFLLSLGLLSFFFASSAAAFEVPPNDGFITDPSAVLSEVEEQNLENILTEYRSQTSNEIAALIVDTLGGENIRDVGLQVGRTWGVGTEENDNGILILIARTEREVSIEVGYGLEGPVPDLVAKGIIEEEMVPKLREGEYADALAAAIDALQKHIGGEYTADRYAESDGGGLGVFLFIFLFIGVDFLAAFLGRSRSWWLGGVLGGVFGIILALVYYWWFMIPILVGLGLLFDFIVSRTGLGRRGRRGGRWHGGGWGGGGSSSGGFGGFSGGSFGGGGASGKF